MDLANEDGRPQERADAMYSDNYHIDVMVANGYKQLSWYAIIYFVLSR